MDVCLKHRQKDVGCNPSAVNRSHSSGHSFNRMCDAVLSSDESEVTRQSSNPLGS